MGYVNSLKKSPNLTSIAAGSVAGGGAYMLGATVPVAGVVGVAVAGGTRYLLRSKNEVTRLRLGDAKAVVHAGRKTTTAIVTYPTVEGVDYGDVKDFIESKEGRALLNTVKSVTEAAADQVYEGGGEIPDQVTPELVAALLNGANGVGAKKATKKKAV